MKFLALIFLFSMIVYSQQDKLPKTIKIHEVIDAFNDSLDVVDAVILTKVPYLDTTNTIAMQWELDGKQANIPNIADTSKYVEYSDTTALLGMQWELDGKVSNTGGTINGAVHINSGDNYTPLTLEGNGSGNSASFILSEDGDLTLQPANTGTKITIDGILHIDNNNITVADSTASIILKDSAGKNWKIKVNTQGTLSADSTGLN